MLRKKTNGVAKGSQLSSALSDLKNATVDRRAFLKRSGLAIGGAAAISTLSSGMVRKANAQGAGSAGNIEIKKSVAHTAQLGARFLRKFLTVYG